MADRFLPDRKGPLNGLRIRLKLWQVRGDLDVEDKLLAVQDFDNLYPGIRLEMPVASGAVAPLIPVKFSIEVLAGDGTLIKDAIVMNEYRQHQYPVDG